MHLAIVSVTDGRVGKFARYEFEADAIAHVVEHGGFVAADPGGTPREWLADPVGQTLVMSPPVPTAAEVDDLKLDAKRRVVARADQLGEVIAGLAPNFEKHSWPDKRAAAAAVAAGLTVADEPRIAILEAERQVTGETLADLAAKILANVDLANPANYYAAVGLIAGQRRMTLAAIDALADPATVKEDIAAVIAAAEAEAQALLASLLA